MGMTLLNSKDYQPEIDVNGGIFQVDQIQLVERASDPSDADLADGRIYHQTGVGFRFREGGSFGSIATTSSPTFTGTTIVDNDNATAFRIKGASHANSASAGADIQSYAGMFTNDNYNNATAGGVKKNRLTFGANQDMDLVIQGPHQVRIVAADNNVTGGDADAAVGNGVGDITMISRSDVTISPWAAAEALGDNYLVITAATETVADVGGGGYQGGDMVIKVNTGNLYLNKDVTDGAVVLPSLTTAERDALTGVAGQIVYNESTNKLNFYNGSAWEAVTSS